MSFDKTNDDASKENFHILHLNGPQFNRHVVEIDLIILSRAENDDCKNVLCVQHEMKPFRFYCVRLFYVHFKVIFGLRKML